MPLVSRKVKVGVVGVGHQGYHHARLYSQLPQAELVGVVDLIEERAQRVAEEFKTRAFVDSEPLVEEAEAVSIVVPTREHFKVAEVFLEAGKHVLLEKPIASTLKEADRLLTLAQKKDLVFMVGHSERFNEALQKMYEVVVNPLFIEVHRLSLFPARGYDVDVVLDLMTHDLDIVLGLVNSKLAHIEAVGVPVISPLEDIANARLRFENGCIANITASRVSAETLRKIRIFQPSSYISLDYAKQELKIYKKKEGSLDLNRFPLDFFTVERVPVDKGEPLKREIQFFIDSVVSGHPFQKIAREARDTLEVSLSILQSIRSHQIGG